MKPEDFDYVVANNVCLFQKGPLSQWWGGFKNQNSTFKDVISIMLEFGVSKETYDHIYNNYHAGLIEFNCCEQYMMAAKSVLFNDTESLDKIMATTSPQQQKDLGRGIKNFDAEKWDKNKFDIVYRANMCKFSQIPELTEFLLSFNPHIIFAEASPWDKVWGIGMDSDDYRALDINKWNGENLLGKAITMVRDHLSN